MNYQELSSNLISIIIPMKNESATLEQLFSTLAPILAALPIDYEVIAVNDGSNDDTLTKLIKISKSEHNLKIVDLSRNFGKEAALYAGFNYARGDCAVAIDAFLSLGERVRFNKGLFAWIGFKEKLVYHKRSERSAGTSQWKYLQLFKFAIDGITSFSKAPLEVWFYLGIFTAIAGFLYGLFIFTRTILLGIDTPGYASLLIFVLFFSGLQMVGIGILGKYIGRIFIESKHRPIFVVRKIYDSSNIKRKGDKDEL